MDNREILAFCKTHNIAPAALATLIEILGPERAYNVVKSGQHINRKSGSMQTGYKTSQPTFVSGVDFCMSKAFKGWKHG